MDLLLLDLRVVEPEEVFGFGAEVLLDFAVVAHGAGKVGVWFGEQTTSKGRVPVRASSHNSKTAVKA
jgi:hypothetical protein